MDALNPDDFDVDAWIADAKLPEHTVTVYGRADLLAEADKLIDAIEAAENDRELERSVGESSADELRAEYERVREQFLASAMHVRVRAISSTEAEELDKRQKEKELTPAQRQIEEIVLGTVSPKLTTERVERLADTIGSLQTMLIWNGIRRCGAEVPEVSAAFLPSASGRSGGED